ncbi:hypothetical protein GCM10011367_04570 [Marinicauda pacifica]|jgi:hypothetical protein|uniref:STAS domain-containing protein n=1 Tax=Marinicauda pacifica TaxID=1133559 RepID=A0A4S2HDK5_9PROT|nr:MULTISPECIES: hypothetical protein [Marinicauda]TGY94135.1 hypothetical protein E5162_02315 [Marinicauda pacifica]GGE33163.1 hypothetical protein GCM10011367_04570 [Marinicauda pacifica]
MAFEIVVQGTCMIATQTGILDWQDCDYAFARCDDMLAAHPGIDRLLLDLSGARLAMKPLEARSLAKLARAAFSRPVKTAIVHPIDETGAAFLQSYVMALQENGARVALFRGIEPAQDFLRPRNGLANTGLLPTWLRKAM